ncbi:MAG: hypothetical protein UT38_C0014G0020 [Microgenomates group bacterium GW2011_GWA2_39_19]|nr:MAG: hypothetical protein UT38_C0014G0020 [Microgenomates group bacterium GW2011_GWA2_39_19]HBL52081.1 hypothetical protein [Candidatus Blackburnbacteria bacterium]
MKHFSQLLVLALVVFVLLVGVNYYLGTINQKTIIPSSLPSVAATVSPSPSTVKIYNVPINWQTYKKKFEGRTFSFRYPTGITINDGDESSGNITLISKGARIAEIGLLSPYYFQEEYKDGSRRVWFEKQFSKNAGEKVRLTFYDINLANSKNYLQVIADRGRVFDVSTDTYFGVQSGKSVLALDFKQLKKDEFYTILQTLEVK